MSEPLVADVVEFTRRVNEVGGDAIQWVVVVVSNTTAMEHCCTASYLPSIVLQEDEGVVRCSGLPEEASLRFTQVPVELQTLHYPQPPQVPVLIVASEFMIASHFYRSWCEPSEYVVSRYNSSTGPVHAGDPLWRQARDHQPWCVPHNLDALARLTELSRCDELDSQHDHNKDSSTQKRLRTSSGDDGPNSALGRLVALVATQNCSRMVVHDSLRLMDHPASNSHDPMPLWAAAVLPNSLEHCMKDTTETLAPPMLSLDLTCYHRPDGAAREALPDAVLVALRSLVSVDIGNRFVDDESLEAVDTKLLMHVIHHLPSLQNLLNSAHPANPSRSLFDDVWGSIGHNVGLSAEAAAFRFSNLLLDEQRVPRTTQSSLQNPEGTNNRDAIGKRNSYPMEAKRYRSLLHRVTSGLHRHMCALDRTICLVEECIVWSLTPRT